MIGVPDAGSVEGIRRALVTSPRSSFHSRERHRAYAPCKYCCSPNACQTIPPILLLDSFKKSLLPHISLILHSKSTAISSLLIFRSHSKFTSFHRSNFSHTGLHLSHYLDPHPISIRHDPLSLIIEQCSMVNLDLPTVHINKWVIDFDNQAV